jgi:YbbR domain-containing protein
MMKKLFGALISNYKSMAASFLVAIILWAAVTTNRTYTERIEVPFAISRLAPDRILKNLPPSRAILEISGRGRSLIALNFFKPYINLELPDIEYSTIITLDNYKNQFKIGREIGVEVVEIIEPKTIELSVDRLSRERKAIRLRGAVKTLPGYILAGIDQDQDSVTVSGPRSLIRILNWIDSDSFQFNNVRYPFESEVELASPAPGIIHIVPLKVLLKFRVEALVERTLYNIPIQIVGSPGDLIATTSPASMTIRVKGGEQTISALTAKDIHLVFNYNERYRQGNLYYTPEIKIPKGVSALETSPRSFLVRLKRRAE